MMILLSFLFKYLIIAYNDVVLPLPVGPVTKTIPIFLSIYFLILVKICRLNPTLSNDISNLLLSKILRTIDSPSIIGIVETRKS